MKRRLLKARDPIRASSARDVGAVLALMISVQGPIVVAQFPIAIAVNPIPIRGDLQANGEDRV